LEKRAGRSRFDTRRGSCHTPDFEALFLFACAATCGTALAQRVTVVGCLSGSADNYNLTDEEQNVYRLKGPVAELRGHTGDEI